ncbi:unnamed protein product [Vitrella brassicaformis CCMP3155]|uniref:Uncharacterized protein n=1 Tax=Vitrella brassicaformis (strain CCMP3155) TaxID=1169540 RepID=A0A0G4E8F2_VITBC|nr:unnamed protein product [Vitrella brassicaformis CCMP3155]|mmetsp:Transcript_28472/g.71096  ORF Transcript_28472/g.71096 Transcript_28472/m.71096 type:complete len:130 (-) Transcript_28472:362-751(-)|eukprot:CEL91582.1 unnamed protein product [Vitrella brassicaformis CCMP3155]
MITQSKWRISVYAFDQGREDISFSFQVCKDGVGRPCELGREYWRQLWVFVGGSREGSVKQGLRSRLKQQRLRYGCTVDTLQQWNFYKYDEETETLVHLKYFDQDKEGHPQQILDYMILLLHEPNTALPR